MKCYCACFNVGNVEVWTSDLFLTKKSVLIEVEESIEEIAEEISEFSFLSKTKIIEAISQAIKRFKKAGSYKDKDSNFDFFILEQYVWKNIQDRDIFIENIKNIENGTI